MKGNAAGRARRSGCPARPSAGGEPRYSGVILPLSGPPVDRTVLVEIAVSTAGPKHRHYGIFTLRPDGDPVAGIECSTPRGVYGFFTAVNDPLPCSFKVLNASRRPVELTRIIVYSQHSGKYNLASAVGVQAKVGGTLQDMARVMVSKPEATVSFDPTKARSWKLHFRTGRQPKVCIRGLRYFSGDDEVFPPLVPVSGE